MKKITCYFIILTFCCFACQKKKEDIDPKKSGPDTNIRSKTPCGFALTGVEANATLTIDCLLDLKGETITLPANVKIDFAGGDIINGTLKFSGGYIDGKLLSSQLTIEGDVQLKTPAFEFIPSRWDIVEGKVDDDRAQLNTNNFEALITQVKDMGGNEFQVDAFDAYFKVDGLLSEGTPAKHAINLPSDYHLSMSANTHLRMQPHGHFRAVLLAIYGEKNIKVSGGTLHGERDEHNYNSGFVDSDGSKGPTHEWVSIMTIKGGQEIVIDNVTFTDPAGDCLSISSIYHYFDPKHIRSKNITLKNNKFIRARRTNLVITSAEEVSINQNEFIDGGIDTQKSKGVAPSSNFNMEPHRSRDPQTGKLIEYERVSHIYIENNKQIVNNKAANPRAGEFQLSHGNGPIIVKNNEMINTGISFSTVDGVVISDNTITGAGIAAGIASNIGRTDVVFGNEILRNTVKSDGVALNIAGNGVLAKDNILEGVAGVVFGAGATETTYGTSNSSLVNNKIKASKRGVVSMNTLHKITIKDNTIEMQETGLFAFVLDNKWTKSDDASFIVNNNTVTGKRAGSKSGAPACLVGANSLHFTNNSVGDLQIAGGSYMQFEDNIFDASTGAHGILFNKDCPHTSFTKNKTIIYPSKTPLDVKCIKMKDGITLSGSVKMQNNTCVEE